MKICDLGVDLEREEDADGFTGVNLERDEETCLLKMKQPDLIDFVIIDVRLDNGMAKGEYTPDGSVSLVKNEDGVPSSGIFNYSSVVGMMLYLSSHTLPKIDFCIQFFCHIDGLYQAFTRRGFEANRSVFETDPR